MEDLEWAQEQLLWEVGFMGGCPGAYENYLYDQMVKKNGADRPTWQALSPGRRAIVVSYALDRLLGDRRITIVPTEDLRVGSRCFRVENILITIVEALNDDDEADIADA